MNLPKPSINREEAMKLWIEEHSDYAKEQVVLNNVGMVGVVLQSLNLNPHDEDLFSIGVVGVLKAVNSFDPGKGVKFSAYSTPVIRNEILATRRKKRIIPAFSLDEPYAIDDESRLNRGEMIPGSMRFEDDLIENIQLERMFSVLNEREKKILSLSMQGKRQKEICRICGISQPHVSRIKKIIYKKWVRQNDM